LVLLQKNSGHRAREEDLGARDLCLLAIMRLAFRA
jgi:hypothetical protein